VPAEAQKQREQASIALALALPEARFAFLLEGNERDVDP